MTDTRADVIRSHRPRGIYVPIADVPAHLACGWSVIDDCAGPDDVLMRPPRQFEEREAA